MKAKYKVGIENWEFLAICKATGEEVIYNPKNIIGLKRHLTKIGVKSDNPIEHFNIIDNPYKSLERCHCKLCDKTFKDPTNTSGQLTAHIQKQHNVTIQDYVKQFPEETHLFKAILKILSQEDPTLTNEDERIQCPLCNKYFKQIKAAHIKLHGMTVKEFKEYTGLNNLQSVKVKERAKEIYYSEVGLTNHKRVAKPKPEKIKKNKSRKSIKQYVAGIDYHTYDTDTLLSEGRHFIYKLTSPSGKCYVGRTYNFFKRMSSHLHKSLNSKNISWLYLAVRKYGWENFNKEVIDIASDLEDAKQKELYWIKFFDSFNTGYNGVESSDGGVSWEGKKHTQKYKDYIEKVSASSKNRVYGKHSEETKHKLSSKAKGRHTLQWFQDKYGEDIGLQKYNERSENLRNRTDQKRNTDGTFTKTTKPE